MTADDGTYVNRADVRPVAVHWGGEMELASGGGWSPWVAFTLGVQVAGLALASAFLFLLHRVLSAAASGDVFSPRAVARVRGMGWLLIAGGVLGFLEWALGTPSKLDYGSSQFGPAADLSAPGPQSIDLTLFAVGALVLLLAQVFRHGHEVESERRMTI
ncbi:DUF2975 domain-containing protein [Nocardioides yefusunii]|uniref:DUF2975 domain-containing protein n=1 Tax=Nocardioides yefusunii TaxID=2500546 RepID=A0ABW1QUR1_9ACTN|nr:DUF2975 domain-containing protein [Nocardioides yefusunii]